MASHFGHLLGEVVDKLPVHEDVYSVVDDLLALVAHFVLLRLLYLGHLMMCIWHEYETKNQHERSNVLTTGSCSICKPTFAVLSDSFFVLKQPPAPRGFKCNLAYATASILYRGTRKASGTMRKTNRLVFSVVGLFQSFMYLWVNTSCQIVWDKVVVAPDASAGATTPPAKSPAECFNGAPVQTLCTNVATETRRTVISITMFSPATGLNCGWAGGISNQALACPTSVSAIESRVKSEQKARCSALDCVFHRSRLSKWPFLKPKQQPALTVFVERWLTSSVKVYYLPM